MYVNEISGARTQLQGLENGVGKEVLLAQITELETLFELTQQALKQVSDHVSSLGDYHNALVQLRHFLESAQENLRILDKEAADLYVSRAVTPATSSVVRTLFKAVSNDLDRLLWRLPSEPFRPKGPRPLDLSIGRGSVDRSIADQ